MTQTIRPPFGGRDNSLPRVPYGAVYFRKSNPPREDWERDYQTAAEDGMTAFRHWFVWSGIEVAPGKYDWDDYDRQLDLGAKYGIKAIIAEMMKIGPEWARRTHPHARVRNAQGLNPEAGMHGSCNCSSLPMCMDNDDWFGKCEEFLTTLVERYKDHPGLGGYDIWNECGEGPCYCDGTAAKFREWLKVRYNDDLHALGEAWHRYSFETWEDIIPPSHGGAYPDIMDWMDFRIERAHELMRWRFDTIRKIDPNHPITAHGVAKTFANMGARCLDDWRAAAEVESYGYTWGSSRHGDQPWKQFQAVDLVRSASRGKPFWHAEAYGGPLWMARNVLNKPRDEGRIAKPEDSRYWNMASYMAGARGIFYLRWRPLLEGPLFGAFGPYGLDGSRTDRSAMISEVGKWAQAPEQVELWKSKPVKGDVGIIHIPDSELFIHAQQGNASFYASSMEGAYQGFFDLNIQADWVHIDDIDQYDALYLPFPVRLKQATADKLIAWVKNGGRLILEGCAGYFGDNCRAQGTQPGLGLDEMCGASESYVEFVPDLLDDLTLNVNGNRTRGGVFLQAYEPTTGKAVGWYDDGRVAAVENKHGKGKVRLIGTMCGNGYGSHPDDRSPAFFADALEFFGKRQHVTSSEPRIKARIHDGEGGVYLWIANPQRQDLPVTIELSEQWGPVSGAMSLHGATEIEADDRALSLTAPARDVTVIRLQR